MGLIAVLTSPVLVQLEHDDVIVDTVIDITTNNVYVISAVHWQEVAGETWIVEVAHPSTGLPITQTIGPGESGTQNLAVPARFNSYPLRAACGLVRVP